MDQHPLLCSKTDTSLLSYTWAQEAQQEKHAMCVCYLDGDGLRGEHGLVVGHVQ